MYAALAEIFGLIVFPHIAKFIPKKKIYLLSALLPTAGLLLLLTIGFVAPTNALLTAIAGIGLRLGSGLQLGTVTVMLADVVDYGEYKLGTRNESVIFSLQTLLVKFASALGALFTGFALDLTGYIPDAVQSVTTLNGIRFVMIILPIIFVAISYCIYFKYYKLNDGLIKTIMVSLNDKRQRNKIYN